MKNRFSHIGLAKLCGWFGITRQAYYQNSWNAISTSIEEGLILKQVSQIRQNHPYMGTRKLYDKLQSFMLEHQIKMGRDALFNLLAANYMLVKRRKRRIQTTQSYHWFRKYPNLIKSFIPTAPHQLWVSDITYWKIEKGHLYISLVTDAYSHKIIGYQVAETLESIESIQALEMALACLDGQPKPSLIHHSDRGMQYCSSGYVKRLKDYSINISMTENGDPRENAIAERVNGIIKEEYLCDYQVNNLMDAKEILSFVIALYNEERPHMSIGNLTPNQLHHAEKPINTNKLWKKYYLTKSTIVNPLQDYDNPVNLNQDYSSKL